MGLVDAATIHFNGAPPAVTVGDHVSFQLDLRSEGGVTDTSDWFRISQYRANVQRQGTTFLLSNIQLDTNLGSDNLAYDVRISASDDSPVIPASEWESNPKGRQVLTNFNFYTATREGTIALQAEAVDETGATIASDTVRIGSSKFVLSLQRFALEPVKLGDSCSPALVIDLPGPAPFSTAGPLVASVSTADSLKTLVLFDLRLPQGDGEIEVPFDLILRVGVDSGGINQIFFKAPDPPRDVAGLGAGIYNGLPPYIVGRRHFDLPITEAVISVEILVKAAYQNSFEAAPNQGFRLRVLPRQLALQLAPLDGHDTLVLEDDWRADEEKLRGSFVIRALVGEQILYRSDHSAVVAGFYDPGTLIVNQVARRVNASGEALLDRFHPSTTFRLEIDDPQIAEFDVTHLDPSEGTFSVESPITDWISARRDGEARLTCTIEPFDISDPAKIPPDLVFWTLPDRPAHVTIEIKPPLRAHLLTWSDVHFSGSTAVPLDQGSPLQELIYAAGTLTGKIDNHNPASLQEIVKVLVDPPSPRLGEFPVHAGTELHANGDVQVDVDGLGYDLDSDEGANRVTLSAWKPINDVMDGGPDEAVVSLRAVVPDSLEILEPADGITVRRRRLANIKYRYARATLAIVADGTQHLAQNGSETYVATTRDTGPVTLAATAGDHTISLTAFSDFSPFGDALESITIHAPAPAISVQLGLPPDKSQAPNKVGHSVESVTATVTVTQAVTLEVWQGDTQLRATFMAAGAEAPASEDRQVRLPPDGALAIGDNTFELRAVNEFGTASKLVVVKRRAKLFEAHGDPNFSVEAHPSPEYPGSTVFVELSANFSDNAFDIDEVLAWTVTARFPPSASDGSLTYVDGDPVRTFVRVDDEVHDVSPFLIWRVGVLMTGPDFQSIAMLLEPDPSWVVSDPDNVETGGAGLYATVVIDPVLQQDQEWAFVLVDVDSGERLDVDGNPL